MGTAQDPVLEPSRGSRTRSQSGRAREKQGQKMPTKHFIHHYQPLGISMASGGSQAHKCRTSELASALPKMAWKPWPGTPPSPWEPTGALGLRPHPTAELESQLRRPQ